MHVLLIPALSQPLTISAILCKDEHTSRLFSPNHISGPFHLSTFGFVRRVWCRVCGATASPECVKLKHERCNLALHQLRARAGKLQDAAASARKVVQALQGARNAVEAQLEECRGRLWQVEEADRRLRAEVCVAALQVDALEQLMVEELSKRKDHGTELGENLFNPCLLEVRCLSVRPH